MYSSEEWDRICVEIDTTIDRLPFDGWRGDDQPLVDILTELAHELVLRGMGLTGAEDLLQRLVDIIRRDVEETP